jgi:hypothetical protein
MLNDKRLTLLVYFVYSNFIRDILAKAVDDTETDFDNKLFNIIDNFFMNLKGAV